MFFMDFFRGENKDPKRPFLNRGGADIKCNSPLNSTKVYHYLKREKTF